MKAYCLLVGCWIGLCAACIGWTGWGIWFLHTHPSWDPVRVAWYNVVIFGPVILLAMRFWKWIVTICLICFGGHELHKLFKHFDGGQGALLGALIGWQLNKPDNHRRAGIYWAWLTAKPWGPQGLSPEARLVLRFGAVLGFALYSSSASVGFDWFRNNREQTVRAEAALAQSHPETQPVNYTATPSLPVPTPTPTPDPELQDMIDALHPSWTRPTPTPGPRPHRPKHRYVKNLETNQ